MSAHSPSLPNLGRSARWAPWLLFSSVAGIYLIEWWVARHAGGRPDVDLWAFAVVVDLVVGVPLLVYLVAVRKLGWPVLAVVPAAVLGLVTAGWLAPAAKDGVLADFEILLFPLELVVLGVIGWRAHAGWRRLRAERAVAGVDLWQALRRAAAEVAGPGRAAEVLAYELAVQIYAFGFWRRPVPRPSANRFSMDRRSGHGLLTAGVTMAMAVEIVPVHLLIHHFWSPTAAWIVTLLSLYGGVWVIGHWQAVRRQPLELRDDGIELRLGLSWQVTVPWESVASLRRVPPTEARVEGALRAFPAGRPSHCLELSAPVMARGPYGIRREIDRIAFFVDEPERFETAFEERVD